jgi:hypothetical protein
METLRYWIADALYWLADKVNPNELEFHINGKPVSEYTKEEIDNLFK